MLIGRNISPSINRLKDKFPLIALTGPRQAGKTTLLKHLFPDYRYVSLENPDNRGYALQDPNGFLDTYDRYVIFDEVQRTPEIFSYLQTKTDADRIMGQYILSGSQNFLLLESIAQSLAGRVALLRLFPLTFDELEAGGWEVDAVDKTLYTGFYPAVFDRKINPQDYYPNYVETYIERDVQSLIKSGNRQTFYTFIRACAGHIGQLINYKSLADVCGIAIPTAKEWLSILERSYIVFLLSPYYRNFNKRLIKSPKLYFYDTGLACNLLGMNSISNVESYYQKGSLFENLVIAELIKRVYHRGDRPHFYFWRDNHKVEVDLIWETGMELNILEVKSSQTVHGRFLKPLHQLQGYSAEQQGKAYLIYGGSENVLRDGVRVLGWQSLDQVL